MALDAKIIGATSGAGAEVDTTNNLQVNLPYDNQAGVPVGGGSALAGFATMLAEADSGTATGAREVRAAEITTDYRLRTAVDVTMFNEVFPGAVLNSSLWTAPATTSTVTVAGGFLNLNAAGSLASGAVARVSSYRSFPCYATFPTYATLQVAFSATPTANAVHEWGMGIATGITAPTDGAFFRINSTAQLQAVVNSNGAETVVTISDFATLIGVNISRQFLVTVGTARVDFWINNVKVAAIDLPPTAALTTSSAMLPILLRSYNTAAVTGPACTMKVGAINITLGEMNANKPWSHVMAVAGGMSYQGQTGQTLGSTARYSNNATLSPVAANNATAALGSGLGGEFILLPTLAINNDGIISSYQVPIGTASAPGKTLIITGCTVDSVVTTALTGGPVIGLFTLAFGHNSAALSNGVSPTNKAPVRVPMGIQVYSAAAAVGTTAVRLQDDFDRAPVAVYPGEFFQITMKNVGTVTTAGAITYMIRVDGYWE